MDDDDPSTRLQSNLAHFKPLTSLCIEVVCENLALYHRREYVRQGGFHPCNLPNTIWNKLLPSFEEERLLIFYKDKSSELAEVLTLLMETAVHFNFKCAVNLLHTPYEEMLWEALQRKATRLKSVVVPNLFKGRYRTVDSVFAPRLNFTTLSEIPRYLELICSLRSLKALVLPFWYSVDEPALTSIGNNLLNLVYFECDLATEGISKQDLNQFFAKLQHLKEFRFIGDSSDVLQSLPTLNHKLEVAGVEAYSFLQQTFQCNNRQDFGHEVNRLKKPIPLQHLVIKEGRIGKKQIKMLPCVQHLKLIGWFKWFNENRRDDILWRPLLDFENLQSLHFYNANSIFLEFLEKFGPELKGLSLVNVTDVDNPVLPLDQVLQLCPKLESLLVGDCCGGTFQVGNPSALPTMHHLRKLELVNEYPKVLRNHSAPLDVPAGLLIHLLSSPKLETLGLECVKISRQTARTLRFLARSGKIFHNLKKCTAKNGRAFENDLAFDAFVDALSHAPKLQVFDRYGLV